MHRYVRSDAHVFHVPENVLGSFVGVFGFFYLKSGKARTIVCLLVLSFNPRAERPPAGTKYCRMHPFCTSPRQTLSSMPDGAKRTDKDAPAQPFG